MKNLINFIFILLLNTSLTGCGVLFATGNWWNNDYAPYDELWVHPILSKSEAEKISLNCSDYSINSVIAVEKFSEISLEKQKNIIKNLTSENSKNISKIRENCYLDHGFKFYPRGIKRNHPTVCFGESKKMPGCQSVFDIPIL
ncbi:MULTISPECIES: hypothetical protein [unclassified Acinetobacter]|uniref:hypothetical protein n=1 Tax=unclassified Acinetobacter TaxID=196816 RepID=UPI002934D06B|nr:MULTISPECIES: hypothetical protein [unclassified Acinetobacter]WOE32906.1 hypothetical protein QSG84_07030 [Acinetobacter sp. SAAs470]WOE38383.1 hypothetical protein QSG86_16085 [Acinetobacter sp. SAAs474]